MTDIQRFNCSICNIDAITNSRLQRHFKSNKHIQNVKSPMEVGKFQCKICNKKYKGASGLWAHKKKCTLVCDATDNNSSIRGQELSNNQDVIEAIRQLAEQMKLSNEQVKLSNEQIHLRLDSMSEKNNSSITTINNEITNNNTFNINVFLNEKCSKAINMDDFIKNICYEFGDFNKMLEDYVGGSMSILKNNMNQIPLHKRPMHYLEGEDKNQQVFHIRQNDIWKMETEINWLKQIDADDDDVLEKQTLYFALKQLDNDKLKYLRYKYSANHDYMKNHKRLNCEVTRVDLKKKLYDELINMIKLDPKIMLLE
jgi:transcription elongation factor Elf1